jgi:hypothetical protein
LCFFHKNLVPLSPFALERQVQFLSEKRTELYM